MVIRYIIEGRGNLKFSRAGSFGSKKLAIKKANKIIKLRKEANLFYKSIKVKPIDIKI